MSPAASASTVSTPTTARAPAAAGLAAAGVPAFAVPARHNPRLRRVVARIAADAELREWWRCASVNAVERLGLCASGEVHARIVANAALRLLRLLGEGGQVPGVVAQHRLTADDAEVVVVLAAALHDLGLALGLPGCAEAGSMLAHEKARELLGSLYPVRERTAIVADVLLAISSQPAPQRCLTLEARVLRLADVLDLAPGRMGAQLGSPVDPAGVMIDQVIIERAMSSPVRVLIETRQAGGVGALRVWLRDQLRGAEMAGIVEMVARHPAPGGPVLTPLSVWEMET